MRSLPDLRFLLSINSENAWSDLLATLMNADQAITRSVLGINADGPLQIHRIAPTWWWRRTVRLSLSSK